MSRPVSFAMAGIPTLLSATVAETGAIPLNLHVAQASAASLHPDAVISYGLYASGTDAFMAKPAQSLPTRRSERGAGLPRGFLERSVCDVLTVANRAGKRSVAVDFDSIDRQYATSDAALWSIFGGIQMYMQQLSTEHFHNSINAIVIAVNESSVLDVRSALEDFMRSFFPNAVDATAKSRELAAATDGRMEIDFTRGLIPPASILLPRELTIRFISDLRQGRVEEVHRVTTAEALRKLVTWKMAFLFCKAHEGPSLYLVNSMESRSVTRQNHNVIHEARGLLSQHGHLINDQVIEKGYIKARGNGSFVISELTTRFDPDTLRVATIASPPTALGGAHHLFAYFKKLGIDATVETAQDESPIPGLKSHARMP